MTMRMLKLPANADQKPDPELDLLVFPGDIVARHGTRSSAGSQKTAKHSDRRSLSCTVSAQETEDFPLPYRKAHMIHGGKSTEPSGQPGYLYRQVIFTAAHDCLLSSV